MAGWSGPGPILGSELAVMIVDPGKSAAPRPVEGPAATGAAPTSCYRNAALPPARGRIPTPSPMEPVASTDSQRTAQDAALVRAVADGSPEAVEELYDRYGGMLLGLARKVVKDPADAEEVLQETFVHVWNRAASYDPARSSVATWLVLITRSRAIDRVRTKNVVDRTHAAVQKESGPDHESALGASLVLDRERRQRVRSELQAIPEEQRTVLELAFYHGLTQREIAERTGIPLGTVKTRTLLAMNKLRKALRDEIRELL